jgi:curved DNA-binding protein CbpA
MSDRDYYEILGLTPEADGAMVDQAYWHVARRLQALSEEDPRARYMLDDLNEAYGVLGTPRLRHEYDAFRRDVLLTQGMVQRRIGRSSARQPQSRSEPPSTSEPSEPLRLPRIENWRLYATSSVIVALALAGAWQGVNILFVGLALAAGLALSLTPLIRRQLPEVHLAMPAVTMPDLRRPQFQVPWLEDDGAEIAPEPPPVSPAELRASTAAMIERWRTSVGLPDAGTQPEPEDGPDTTLVEIFRSEKKIDAPDEPLAAVLDILRGTGRPADASRGHTS